MKGFWYGLHVVGSHFSPLYLSFNREAPEKGINYFRIATYIVAVWTFLQLLNLSFLDDFKIKSDDDSVFAIDWVDRIIKAVEWLALTIAGLGSLILFFLFLALLVILLVVLVLWLWRGGFCYSKGCRTKCCRRKENKFVTFLDALFDKGSPLIFGLQLLYIPIMSSLLKAMICTYHCDQDPNSTAVPYPPLDEYTSISCKSSEHAVCFGLAALAIAVFHPLASYVIIRYEERDDRGRDLTSLDTRFEYAFTIGKV